MTTRLLFVDDEPNVLSGFTRILRKEYDFDTAVGGAEGLELMKHNLYAVIVSDMRMPEMSGEDFLARAHIEQPDAVQMILSGQANLESTVAAVNNGNIFRFLLKPTDKEILTLNLNKALRQFAMINAERLLLQDTLAGAVGALTEVLSLVSPVASRRTNHVITVVKHIAEQIGLEDDWQLTLAAMLSGVGYAAVPTHVVEKFTLGQELDAAEEAMIARYPEITTKLLGQIPRLEGVSGIIRATVGAQQAPQDLERQTRLLDLAVTVANGIVREQSMPDLIIDLRQRGSFDQDMIASLETLTGLSHTKVEELPMTRLTVGMTLQQDVLTTTNVMLASRGTVLTESLLERLRNFAASTGVAEPILVAYSSA